MEFDPLPVPGDESEITAPWLSRALAPLLPDVLVREVTRERIGAEYGLASEIFRCRLEGSAAPDSVVVKLWDVDGAGGTREVRFYRELVPLPGLRLPTCYHGAIDEEKRRGVLVLEDMVDYTIQGDCLRLLSLSPALALADSIAALHAAWWGHPALVEAAWLPSMSRIDRGRDWLEPRRERFLQRFGHQLDHRTLRLLEKVEQIVARVNDLLARAPLTLLHADFHLDNVLLEAETGQPILLDWARVAKGPAVLELRSLLSTVNEPADREPVLVAYLDGLARRGVPPREASALRAQLGAAFLRGFLSATIGTAYWEPDSAREQAMIEAGLQQLMQESEEWEAAEPALFSF